MTDYLQEQYNDLAERACRSIRYRSLLEKITRKPITFQSPEECVQVFLKHVDPGEARAMFGEFSDNFEHAHRYLKTHRFIKLKFSTRLRPVDLPFITMEQLREQHLWLNPKNQTDAGKSKILSLVEELLDNVSESCSIHVCIVPFAHYEKHFGVPTYLVTDACAANSDLIWLGKYFRD